MMMMLYHYHYECVSRDFWEIEKQVNKLIIKIIIIWFEFVNVKKRERKRKKERVSERKKVCKKKRKRERIFWKFFLHSGSIHSLNVRIKMPNLVQRIYKMMTVNISYA